MIFKNKKGELTSKQIISIVILILSFTIILLFFFSLDFFSEADLQACRNSVILKDKVKTTILNCKTQDLCFSMGENCDEQLEDTKKIKLESETVEGFYESLAGKHSDCWWMFGEDDVDLGKNFCGICNILSFDEDFRKNYNSFSREDYFKYLESNQARDIDISYLYYLYGETSWTLFRTKLVAANRLPETPLSNFDTSKKYFLYYVTDDNGIPGTYISVYDSDNIKALECKNFGTQA